jgi:hypothetical protein
VAHYQGHPYTAAQLVELVQERDREIEALKAALHRVTSQHN